MKPAETYISLILEDTPQGIELRRNIGDTKSVERLREGTPKETQIKTILEKAFPGHEFFLVGRPKTATKEAPLLDSGLKDYLIKKASSLD